MSRNMDNIEGQHQFLAARELVKNRKNILLIFLLFAYMKLKYTRESSGLPQKNLKIFFPFIIKQKILKVGIGFTPNI
jgi:hypothetical protein